MKEFRMNVHLGEWYLRTEYIIDRRKIEIKVLFLTFNILKNKSSNGNKVICFLNLSLAKGEYILKRKKKNTEAIERLYNLSLLSIKMEEKHNNLSRVLVFLSIQGISPI